jgi:hypothetical protein
MSSFEPHADTNTQVQSAPVQLTSAFHLLIAGSRYVPREALDYAHRVVKRAHRLGYTIVVGDHPKGVDMAVVYACRQLKAKVLVVGMTNRPRNGGCLHGNYVKIERDLYRAASGHLFSGYHTRDRWMVDNAHLGIFIWNGTSRGTKAGFDYMVSRKKEAHLMTFECKGGDHGCDTRSC